LRDDSKSRKNNNINFWMSKESEKMLIKDRISSSSRIEESCVKVSIC
jgi:hypothetical protein